MLQTAARGLPTSAESCIVAVHDQIAHRLGGTPVPAKVDGLIAHEVRRLWNRPIKTFIPVLDTRIVWEQMHAPGLARVQGLHGDNPEASAAPPRRTHADPDTLVYDDRDTLIYDERDIFGLGD